MRNVAFWGVSILLVLGALSATVSLATMQWLYPETAPTPSVVAAAPPDQGKDRVTPVQVTPQTPAGPGEKLAFDLIQLAASGDLAGAAALSNSLTKEALAPIQALKVAPVQATKLPSGDDQQALLIWADLLREGVRTRGAFFMTIAENKVTTLIGPVAPNGGYKPLSLPLIDEKGRKVDAGSYRGRSLMLVTPRSPEPGLAEALVALEKAHGAQGVMVVLVIDVRSPDWAPTLRLAGYKGPIWRLKTTIESTPVVNQGRLLGAVGLLVDRQGDVVASLTALDPFRYGLSDSSITAIAPMVLKAYGLLP